MSRLFVRFGFVVGLGVLAGGCGRAPAATAPRETRVDRAPASAAPRDRTEGAGSWLEVSSSVFRANVRRMKSLLGDRTRLCAVMKSDAYGHGIELLMPTILAEHVPCVAITSNADIASVRGAGYRGQVLRIRAATPDEMAEAVPFEVEEVVGTLDAARTLSAVARARSRPLVIHLELNSAGMSRSGLELQTDSGRREALAIAALPNLRVAGLMTHFPNEEHEDIRRGLAAFERDVAWLVRAAHWRREQLTLHCANSYAALEVPESRLDLVRVGESLYGGTIGGHTEFQPVMRLVSRVAAVSRYPAGNTVSYDRTHVLRRDSTLANIPIGYANGYPRSLSDKGHVLVRGRSAPLVGRVTMNTILVDVTDLPEVRVGDEVVLWGRQGSAEIDWREIEAASGTVVADLYMMMGNGNLKIAIP